MPSPPPARAVGLLILYAAGGLLWSVLLEEPVGAAFDFTFRYLTVPLAGAVLAGAVLRRPESPALARPLRRWLAIGMVYAVLLLLSPPHVLAVNSLGAGGEPVTLSGPVVDKWTRSYKTTSHYVRIVDDATGRPVKLEVSPAEYRAIAVGARYDRRFFVGRLGLPYRWRRG